MNKKIGMAAVLALAACMGNAQADSQAQTDGSNYVGVAMGFSHSQDLVNNVAAIASAAGGSGAGGVAEGRQGAFAGGVYLGKAFGRYVEGRIGYTYLGRYSATATYTSGAPGYQFSAAMTWTALSAAVLLKAPLSDTASLYVALGYAATHADESFSDNMGDSGKSSDNKSIVVPGLGFKTLLANQLSANFEVDYYSKLAGSSDGYNFSLTTFTGGLQYHF